jgi:LCP family protein required for cell wall assembly
MRTTLKRGVGRGAEVNGNGHSVYPPAAVSAVTRYEQPPRHGRSGLRLVGRILFLTLLVAVSLALAAAGGLYLWFHQSVAAIRCHEADCRTAQKRLVTHALPGQAAIALLIGYDYRVGDPTAVGSRSDTVMLVRADPVTKTISLLSFPRDLIVPVYCKNGFVTDDRINSAYSRCGSTGTLETVKHLTGLPVNYLIKVNFHGFKEIVDQLGGVWMDVDRRYYNRNVGSAATNFANINLQPGYQQLGGGSALEFVRYRHTDSDLYRLARQQQFVRAFKEQVAKNFDVTKLQGIVSTVTHNVEVAACKACLSDTTVLRYALFAATLPNGHFFQDRINGVEGYSELHASSSSIHDAVNQFVNPDVTVAKVANAAALGHKMKTKTPAPQQTSVTVLNGNGVPGSAANASYLLAQRGYLMLLPPNGLEPNAPTSPYFHSQIYFDKKQKGAKEAAVALQKLMQPADVRPLPKQRQLRALDPGSMLLVIVGQTFHNTIPKAPVVEVPKRQPPYVRFDRSPGEELLRPLVSKVPFRLEVPTVLERSSTPDTLPSDKPVRLYWIDGRGKHKAVRLVFRTGTNEFWGIEETNWPDAPVLADRSFQHDLGGREFSLYYSGSHLHMVVLRNGDRSYWVVNTLLDSLSNETMLAIAKGLKPMQAGK